MKHLNNKMITITLIIENNYINNRKPFCVYEYKIKSAVWSTRVDTVWHIFHQDFRRRLTFLAL